MGDFIVFNNSFLSRRESKGTNKSADYLCVMLDPNAEPGIMRIDGRSSSTRFNSTFKRISHRKVGDLNIRDLRNSIASRLKRAEK